MKIINTHCHLINFRFIPNSFFIIKSKFLKEWMLKNPVTRTLSFLITKAWPGKKNDLFHQQLKLMKKNIYQQAKDFLNEMKDADEIVLAIPLMMDLEISSSRDKPEIPYTSQINIISDIALIYPGVFIPFIMVDPRRDNSFELTVKSLEKLGFLGIKMYPPLGYHPDCTSICNEDKVNNTLEKIYKYCNDNNIPITTHCSKGGAYSHDLISGEEARHLYTNPNSWRPVIEKYKNIKFNLAHFGGDFLKRDKKSSWSNTIIGMINDYPNVFTDLSYHDDALIKKTRKKYFTSMNSLLEKDTKVREKVLFGTDWSMTRHTWKEKDYVKYFKSNLSYFEIIAFDNPLKFLFHNNNFQQTILDFYERNGITRDKLPNWLRHQMSNIE